MQYDEAGNLEFDGQYFYQYDAWNRLLQVNEAEWDPIGEAVDIGLIVKHYTYDGHGRLIRIQSPFPDPWTAAGDDFRTERLYYDGIRRIQEVVVDPVQGNGNGQSSEEEEGQIGGGTAAEHLEREYVWGPGDNGFDELLVQYDNTGAAWWAIMDAGGDLVALCDFGGGGGGDTARVVGQWTYDAYGAVLSADHLYPMALPHLGHKGLFLDRLDVGIVTGPTGPESPRLVPYAHSLYHNRNRAYSPALGRFFQRDPNATGVAIMTEAASLGVPLPAAADDFDVQALYSDGMNLYEYLGANSWNRSDPMGLFYNPLDPVDQAELLYTALAVLDVQGTMLSALEGMVQQYSSNQEYDVEWALDLSLPDDWHSRLDNSWIPLAMGAGVSDHLTAPWSSGSGLFASAAGGAGFSKAVRQLGLTFSGVRRMRLFAIRVAQQPWQSGARLTQAGRALTKHPDFAGLSPTGHVPDGFKLLKARFGGVNGINEAGLKIAKRYMMQGIPRRTTGGRIKFWHPNGKGIVVTPSKTDPTKIVKIDFHS